jgi:hypothetical protein
MLCVSETRSRLCNVLRDIVECIRDEAADAGREGMTGECLEYVLRFDLFKWLCENGRRDVRACRCV